jgi:predicted dehydrogenase
VVATPNGFLEEIACAALAAGKHVLIEKPMGRSLAEAERMRAAAQAAGRVLKVGFNHRYHPAIAEAHRRLAAGEIGEVISVRCRYGHGGRPGYEKEWRGSRELAGGGELTDQGVHVVDLIHWFAGVPATGFAMLQTAVWPLGDLEDNAFGMFGFPGGAVATFHTSWTQWKNLFSLEVFGRAGALVVEGLGRSYGPETLTAYRRRPEGGVPESDTRTFEGEDPSWRLEWADFVGAVQEGRPMLGTAEDGVVAMRMLDALYRAARDGRPVGL